MIPTPERPLEILHVEDNDGDALLARLALQNSFTKEGCRLHRVRAMGEAMALLQQQPFDAVLLDLKLHDTAGESTVCRIRSLDANVPILVLSGEQDMDRAIQCMREGAQGFIVKGSSDGRALALSLLASIERKANERQLRRLANEDVLTGLPNRRRFLEHLEQMLRHGERWKHRQAILFMDVNGFKSVNDTHGHEAGDALLKQIALRLHDGLRACDMLARYAGDEFVVHLDCEQSITLEDCVRVATKISGLFDSPIPIDGVEIMTGISIGIAVFPECGRSVETLLRQADLAMYTAKRNQRAFAFAGPLEPEISTRRVEAG